MESKRTHDRAHLVVGALAGTDQVDGIPDETTPEDAPDGEMRP